MWRSVIDDVDVGEKYADDVKNLIHYVPRARRCLCCRINSRSRRMQVQTGFGRTGTHYWGFEMQDAIPDIVTMAKGIGNGCPLSAVVTTPKIAQTLAERLHFNTFGGNPVACAQGSKVLDIIERENMQANSLNIGSKILGVLHELKEKYKLIGDVRGKASCFASN